MKALRSVRRLLALAVAVWSLAVAAYFIFFAKISFESVTLSGDQGEASAPTRISGQIPWLSEAEWISVAVMLAFSVLLIACAFALWRGALAVAAPLSFVALLAAYITGFSIGIMYFPGAAGAFLGSAILAIERILRQVNRPAG